MWKRRKRSEPKAMPSKPRIAGIGLVALDLVWSADRPEVEFYGGGTCGNVLAILGYLGWRATPIARIGDDIAGMLLKDDLARWGTDPSLISLAPTTKTPVIVEKIRNDRNGIPFHTFSFHCPSCGRRFPGFQPVTAKGIEPASTIVQRVDILFIDRVSKSSMLLAEAASKAGVIIVFEPVSLHESKAFTHLLDLANIVKYSHDRIDELPPSTSQSRQLEIQTFGRGGLRFKLSGERRWRHMEAEPVERLVDAAGSGDWLTAGFLYGFYRGRARSQKSLEQEHVILALTLGQKLAAWNCGFRGARGGMYSEARSRIAHIIAETLSRSAIHLNPTLDTSDEPSAAREVCLNCADSRVGSVHSSSAVGTMAISGGHR
jgi:sugar/nucleoside kinase (ribokinase family)